MKTLCLALVLPLSSVLMAEVPDKSSPKEKIEYIINALRADNLQILDAFYDPNLHFVDPIGELRGLDKMKAYYAKMYKNVQEIKFDFHEIKGEGNDFFGTWTMSLTASKLNGGKPVQASGVSHIRFDAQNNLVVYHRDYLDMYEFIYQHIPFVGYVTRKVNEQFQD